MKKNHIIAAVTAGLMLTSTAVEIINSSLQVHTVYAISAAAKKVGDKLDLINKTIKSNVLDTKNIALIKTMLSEVKSLNSKLSDGATKKGYTGRILKIDGLILVAEGVNSLEISYNKNSKTIGNAIVWEGNIKSINTLLAKVDKNLYKSECEGLVSRITKINNSVNNIKSTFQSTVNRAEALLKEGEALASKDKNAAIEKLKQGKAIAVGLSKHESKLPLIKRINNVIKSLDESLLRVVKVNSEEDAKALKGFYDSILVGGKPFIKIGELTNVEVVDLYLYSGSISLINSTVGTFYGDDLKDIMGVFLEKSSINNLYVKGGIMLYDREIKDPMEGNQPINVKNIFIDVKNGVDDPFISLQCGVGNLYVNSQITLMAGGLIKNLNINSPNVYCELVGKVESLTVEKGAKNLVIRGMGSIEKANVQEPGVIVSGIKIPEKTPNIEKSESKAIVKRVMKFIVDMDLSIRLTDPIEGYKEYLSQVVIDDIKSSIVAVSGKENIYKVTISNGNYSESKEVKIIILKPSMTIEKKGEIVNGEGNFKLSSKNGIGTKYMINESSVLNYTSDGGYIALQVIDSTGKTIRASQVFESITFKRDEEFIDIIPDNNREKADFGIEGYSGQESKLSQPEDGNSIFYGVRSFKDNLYSFGIMPDESLDIVIGVKGKQGAVTGEYIIRITPAIQGDVSKFTKISDPIEYKYVVK
ncbi:MAG: hypothetical protein RR840_04805 [Clostridium sp.]